MRYHGDDEDIRELVRHGASSWAGPSPKPHQSRWAERGHRRPWARAGRPLAFSVVALVVGSLALMATSGMPNGPAASVMRLVSHVLAGPPAVATPAPVIASSPSPSGAPAPSVAPTPTVHAPHPTPTPTRHSGQDDRPPTASPAPASPAPSASPTHPPDE